MPARTRRGRRGGSTTRSGRRTSGSTSSKVALVGLVHLLDDGQDRLVDCQWQTPHLASLGVGELTRRDYLRRLRPLLDTPAADFPRGRLDVHVARRRGTVAHDSSNDP